MSARPIKTAVLEVLAEHPELVLRALLQALQAQLEQAGTARASNAAPARPRKRRTSLHTAPGFQPTELQQASARRICNQMGLRVKVAR